MAKKSRRKVGDDNGVLVGMREVEHDTGRCAAGQEYNVLLTLVNTKLFTIRRVISTDNGCHKVFCKLKERNRNEKNLVNVNVRF